MPVVDLDLTDDEILALFQKSKIRTPKIGDGGIQFPGYYSFSLERSAEGFYPYHPTPRYDEPNIIFCFSCGYIGKYTEDFAKACPDCENPLLLGFAVSADGSPCFPIKGIYPKGPKPDYYPEGKSPYYKMIKKMGENKEEEEIYILPLEYYEGESENSDTKNFALETRELIDIPIFETGTHNGDEYVETDLDELVKNFGLLEGLVIPPFKLGHLTKKEQKKFLPSGMPALGKVTELKRKGKVLLASIKQVPKRIAELVEAGAYSRISPEIYMPYKDQVGKIYKKVLAAVALLGADVPAVKTLPAIEKLYQENSGNPIKFYGGVEIMAVTPEQLEVMRQEMATMKATVAELTTAVKDKDEEILAKETEIKAKEDEIKDRDGKLEAADEAMKTKDVALQEAATTKRNDEIRVFMTEKKAEGKILPVFETPLEALLQSTDAGTIVKYSEADKDGKVKEMELSQLDLVKSVIDRLPKLVEFEELSSSEGDGAVITTQAQIERTKKEYSVNEEDNEVLTGLEIHNLVIKRVEEKKISYPDALAQVYQELGDKVKTMK